MENYYKGWIMNLTQHKATPEQIAAGVIDLPDNARAQLSALLTFEEIPTSAEVSERASVIAFFAQNQLSAIPVVAGAHKGSIGEPPVANTFSGRVMIGGAPYLMAPLERALQRGGLTPVYAFSRREMVEEMLPDGSVKKSGVFRHLGFVEVSP